MRRKTDKYGFTLVEMLTVIAVIGILIAITVPAIQSARATARRTTCQNRLKQIGLALTNYHDRHRVYPSGSVPNTSPSNPGYAWGVMLYLLPDLEQKASYDSVNFEDPRDCGTIIKEMQAAGEINPSGQYYDVLLCPDDFNAKAELWSGPDGGHPLTGDCGRLYPGCYLGVSGNQETGVCTGIDDSNGGNGMLYTNSRTKMAQVVDGQSMTMIVGERPIPKDYGWGWMICGGTECEHYLSTFRGLSPGDDVESWKGSMRRFWSWHTGGANFLFVDGRVHLLRYDVDLAVFNALSTRKGSESIDAPF